MSCFDAFFFIGPIVTLRGTKECNEFYKKVLSELKQRIEDNISAVEDEKIRLFWDNIPIWTRLRDLSDMFASHGACLVADTYTNAWARTKIEGNDPIKGLGQALQLAYLNIDFQQMIAEVEQMIKRFSADGFVIHSNRSCKPYSLGQFDMARTIQEDMGIPTLIIEADQTDDRVFSEEQTKTRVEAFIETILQKKAS
jgi:benzoyl-CoA reductase/2-hydroxyglutaryl-CoA dehydratase subunit BcrC/BadD/HgdB